MSQAQAVISGSVQVSTGVQGDSTLSELFQALFNANNIVDEPAYACPGTVTVQTLPGSPTKVAYIQNNHATQTLTVTWTPNGGSSAVAIILQPGEFIILGGQTGASGGVTALSLTGSGAGTTTRMILAA
jgi:hypothetical protein